MKLIKKSAAFKAVHLFAFAFPKTSRTYKRSINAIANSNPGLRCYKQVDMYTDTLINCSLHHPP